MRSKSCGKDGAGNADLLKYFCKEQGGEGSLVEALNLTGCGGNIDGLLLMVVGGCGCGHRLSNVFSYVMVHTAGDVLLFFIVVVDFLGAFGLLSEE